MTRELDHRRARVARVLSKRPEPTVTIARVRSVDPNRRARLVVLLRRMLDTASTPDKAGKP